jgi:beta-galactosidase
MHLCINFTIDFCMKFICSFLFLCSIFTSFGQGQKVLFNDNWEFQARPSDPVSVINLPHTPKLETLVMKGQFTGEVLYRKHFNYHLDKGKRLIVEFEGAMHTAKIMLNGIKMGQHVGGYLPFAIDLTGALKDSANVLEVFLDNREDPTVPPGKPLKDLDFYYHAGLYRNVWLQEIGGVELLNPYFQTIDANASSATIQLDFELKYQPDWIRLPLQVEARLGELTITLTNESYIDSTNVISYTGKINLKSPQLWSPSDPNLYDLKIVVIYAQDTIARQVLIVGIRKPELKADGFYLNGSKLFLSGTNRHQEYPYVGYAVPDNALWRDAYLIKQAGFNFVRLSHYPQAPAFYEACDALGIIVMDAIPGWQYFGPAPFEQRCKTDLDALILRDRNHPSVIFWENSLNETEMSETFMIEMNQIAHNLLRDNGFTAGWLDHPSYDVFMPARQHAKAPDYWANYKPKAKALFIAEYGDWEYYAQNAGFNQTQFADLAPSERNSRHLRGASEQALLQQAYNFQEASNSNRKGANSIGEANWVCFDYNRGYSPDLEASGIYDITRLPKYATYFYKSQGLSFSKQPYVSIASRWDANSSTTVTVYSNCPSVSLFLNDKQIALQKQSKKEASTHLTAPPYTFVIPQLEPGKLTAYGLDQRQICVATAQVQTPGKPTQVVLEVDTLNMGIDQQQADLIFIRAKLLDANGTVIPTNNYKATFSCLAEDAGLVSPAIQLFEAGIASALLRTEAPTHPIQIKVSIPDLNLKETLIWKPQP